MNIDEIVNELNRLSSEIEKLKPKEDKLDNHIEEEEKIMKIAKHYPINSHILSKSTDYLREKYIIGLMSIFRNKEQNDEVRLQRLLLIYRIVASFNNEINISQYVTKCMKVEKNFWDNIIETLDESEKFCFIVDLILIGMLDTKSKNKKEFNFWADILQLSGFDKDIIQKAALIANSILKQDFDAFVNLIEKYDFIDYNHFLGYFETCSYDAVLYDLNNAKNIKGNILVANMKIENQDLLMCFDEYVAESIHLKNCLFKKIKGISSTTKRIKIENCTFEGNNKQSKEDKDYIFIQGNNYKFLNTRFLGINVSKSVLNISGSVLENCEFIDCEGKGMISSYMFELRNTDIKHCKMEGCVVESNPERFVTTGGIIRIKFGKIYNCKFKQCTSYYNDEYGHIEIVYALNSKIIGNNFIDCYCKEGYYGEFWMGDSYIVGFKKSEESQNIFENCKAEWDIMELVEEWG